MPDTNWPELEAYCERRKCKWVADEFFFTTEAGGVAVNVQWRPGNQMPYVVEIENDGCHRKVGCVGMTEVLSVLEETCG